MPQRLREEADGGINEASVGERALRGDGEAAEQDFGVAVESAAENDGVGQHHDKREEGDGPPVAADHGLRGGRAAVQRRHVCGGICRIPLMCRLRGNGRYHPRSE